MKTYLAAVIALAGILSAQTPAKKPGTKPVPAAAGAPASALAHATLADLERDFKQRKFAALDAYTKVHGDAKDAPEAIAQAVGLAQELKEHDQVLRLVELYLKAAETGPAALAMQQARAEALRDKGDLDGAQQAFEKIVADAGDDVGALVEAATGLADMLVANGKKDAGIKVLADAGDAHPKVRGLKQHFDSIAKNYELIGTEPIAMGQNDITGQPIDLATYRGKVLMIDFWATWCGPCMGELPNVLAAYEKYHAKGFEILGVSLDEDREAFDKCIADQAMTWRHHFDGNGWKNEIAVAYGVQSIPATYLVGADGKIVAVGLRGDRLEKELERLLGGKH